MSSDSGIGAPRTASFEGLGDLPGGKFESAALRISADGLVIVGNGMTETGAQAFRWTQAEGMTSLGNLHDSRFKQSWAVSVSENGTAIIGYGDPGSSDWKDYQGFLWIQRSGMTEIRTTSHPIRQAFDISADGSVIVGDDREQAFRWTRPKKFERLGVLRGRTNSRAITVSADGSVITGSSYNLPSWDQQEAFIWTPLGGMIPLGTLPNKASSFPNAISADGSVIVGTSGSSAFRWTAATGMRDIGHLDGAKQIHPGGVSAHGDTIVGAGYIDRDHGVAFIWDEAHGMRVLQDVLKSEYRLDLRGWELQNASAITPDGHTIVGWGINPNGHQEAFRVVLSAAAAHGRQPTE
jgi:Predicted integral membrane proteins containing uncharacterized repeats